MKQKGFTLIELLVTMGIIAVLTGMAVFNFNQARARARDVQRKSDLSQIAKALELYRNDNNGKYPPSPLDQQTVLVDDGYSKVIFADPKGAATWADYAYSSSSPYMDYTITACLENTADSTRLLPVSSCGVGFVGVLYQVKNQ